MTAPTTHAPGLTKVRPNTALQVTLWVLQIALAAFFGFAGVLKLTAPFAQLHATMAWTTATPDLVVRFIGLSELLGALGLLIPAATRIKPQLTPLAALGLAVIMVLATGFHTMRGELFALPITVAVGVVAGFVAWARWKKAPISPRE